MDQQTFFNIAVGIILTGIGWFGRELWGSTKDLSKEVHDLQVELPKAYVSKEDFSTVIKELKTQINDGFNRLSDKLDGKMDK